MTTKHADALELAARTSPRLAAAIRGLRVSVDSDEALPAGDKALFQAAAACAQRLEHMTVDALARARDRGIAEESAHGAAALLLLNRGEQAYVDFSAATAAVFGEAEDIADTGEAPSADTSVDEALEYFRMHFGQVPPRQRLFARLAPEPFQSYYLMHQAGLRENVLPHRTAELLLCTVIAAAYEPALLEIHIRSAMGAGATHPQVVEAVLAAVACAGWTVWPSSVSALEATLPD